MVHFWQAIGKPRGSELVKKNIKLKLILNNAVLKGWKAAIRFWSEKDKDR